MNVTASEVGLFGGAWEERSVPPEGRRIPAGVRRAKGDLFVFVAGDAAGTEVEARLRARLAEAYYRGAARSITSSLVAGLEAANRELQAANARADAPGCADVVCLVLREGDAYFARVGIAHAYVASADGVEAVAAPEGGSDAPSRLGTDAEPEIDLSHLTLDRASEIVLGGASLAVVAPPASLERLLALQPEQPVALALRALATSGRAGRAFCALVVEVGVVREAQPAVAAQPADASEEARRPAKADGLPATDRAGRRGAAGGRVSESRANTPASAPEPPFEAASAPAEDEVDDWPVERGPLLGDRVVAALRAIRRTARAATSTRSRLLRTVLLLATVVLVGSAVVVVPLRLWRDRQDGLEGTDLVVQAEQKEREALSAPDPARRLSLLSEASDLADRAARLSRSDDLAQGARQRIRQEIDAAAGAVRLDTSRPLLALEGEPSQVVRGDDAIYVLDRGFGRIYRCQLSDGEDVRVVANAVVLRQGDRVDGVPVGTLRDMLWMPAGSGRATSALLVFDDAGSLFEVGPSSARALRSPSPWRPDLQVSAYAGGLFVLDPLAGSLGWLPPAEGYGQTVYLYLQPDVSVSLADARAIAVDGDLFLLRADGRVERFGRGRPLPFAGSVPDRPLDGRGALLATPRSLWVLDGANRRLVQFDHEGAYQRQYATEAHDPILDAALDEARGLLYYIVNRGVFRQQLAGAPG